MVRKGRLDLMNPRLAGPRQEATVYDSSLDRDLPNTMSTLGTTNYDFDKMLRREQLKDPVIYHTNEIVNPSINTYNGDKVTCQERINSAAMKTYVKERRANHFEHLFNNTAEIFRTARKIDTTLTIKKNDAADDSIEGRMQKNKIPGAQFSKSVTDRPNLHNITTDLGPGDYDITAWESGRCGISPHALKFSGGGGDRTELHYTDEPSATTYFQNTPDISRPATTGSLKFSSATRFPDTNPEYVRGTGLLLSHNFDEGRAWKSRGSYRIKKQYNPKNKPAQKSDMGVDFINTDAGKKMTLKTHMEKSQYKFSPCFKSQSRVGLAIPTPPSGDIGPDHYQGAFKSSLQCTLPENHSSSFASTRYINVQQFGKQYDTLKPRFGHIGSEVRHTREQALNATYAEKELKAARYSTFGRGRIGKPKKSLFSNKIEYDYTPEVKLSHKAEFSKTKILKIYPRMHKEKYGE